MNLKRLIETAKSQHSITSKSKSDLDPIEILEDVRKLKERMIVVPGSDELSKVAQQNARKLFNIWMTYVLSPKKVILEHKLS